MQDGIIRVGLIGAGANTKLRHIPGLREQEGVEIIAVANRSRESGAAVASEYEIPIVYDNWLELMESDEIDAVCVGTWPYMHRTLVMAALENDKHVLTEARMAMDAQEAHDMLDAARQFPHLVTQIVPAPQTLQVDQTVQEIIASGELGQLLALRLRVCDYHGRADRSDTFMNTEGHLHWRQNRDYSGYNIMGMGIWYEQLMRYVGPATKVMAMTRVFTNNRKDDNGIMRGVSVPDHVNVLCEFASGVQADLSWSTVTGMSTGSELWIFGSEGTLKLEGPPFDKVFVGKPGDTEFSVREIEESKRGKWQVEQDFINSIRNGAPVTHTPFDVGVQYMEFTEAVTRSAQSGQAIYLPL
ncbi:MAG: Gfo/Idh/MocA family oxidoreductase [SAR202 cluster bacterium]|nr:Gfo/Idh/MocA family oxidoreductase [SAR202 cluster bacterium]|tara:strand:- start:836 stop:1903 length:1068 start_codon:yes stop_codon:yes gene_type:complete